MCILKEIDYIHIEYVFLHRAFSASGLFERGRHGKRDKRRGKTADRREGEDGEMGGMKSENERACKG